LSSIGGVLLTGGASTRMGCDKATLVVQGETLAARAARILSAVCAPVVEVGFGVTGLPVVREEPAGSGPVAALAAGAGALGGLPVVLLACDMPNVSEAIVRMLAEWPGKGTVVPIAGGRLQYVCARYGSLDPRARALRDLVGDDAELVDESVWRAFGPADAFEDVDVPGDVHRLRLQ
jgi:molybdopterin-guanine dinucleotide biosynthesis protein A